MKQAAFLISLVLIVRAFAANEGAIPAGAIRESGHDTIAAISQI